MKQISWKSPKSIKICSPRKKVHYGKLQVPLEATSFQPYTLCLMASTKLNIIDGVMPWLIMLTGTLRIWLMYEHKLTHFSLILYIMHHCLLHINSHSTILLYWSVLIIQYSWGTQTTPSIGFCIYYGPQTPTGCREISI